MDDVTSEVSRPDFWESRYRNAQTGWDRGRCAPPIERLLREGVVPAGARVAVLGAGRGHEALAAATLGYRATAIDFAPSAVEATRAAARGAGLAVEAFEADLFALPPALDGAFDGVLEHTCFCAIDPTRRDAYVRAARRLLRPGGVVFGLFFAHGREGGPPFATTRADIEARFGPHFTVERLRVAPDSFPERGGEELESILRAKP